MGSLAAMRGFLLYLWNTPPFLPMEIIVIISFGCTTATDDKGHEYNIEGVKHSSPHSGTVEINGNIVTIREGESYKAIKTGIHSVKLIL